VVQRPSLRHMRRIDESSIHLFAVERYYVRQAQQREVHNARVQDNLS